MQGALAEGVLPGILRELYVGRRTGMLYFVRGDERRGVRFSKGHIVRADTNVVEERLGETLVRLGHLSRQDLERATAIVMRDKKRLGVVLHELGVLDKDKLEEALTLHVREILFKVFSWGEGSYTFEDQDPAAQVEEDVTLRLSTGEMILEAVRRVEDPDVVRYALGDIDRVLGMSSDPLLRFQRITLSSVDGYVLSRVDGTLSAREVIQMTPMPAEDVQRSLYGLLCTGVVEYLALPPKPAPKPAPPLKAMPKPATPAPEPAPAAPAPAAPTPAAPAPVAASPAPLNDAQAARRQEILDASEGLKAKNHFEVLGIPRASNEAQVKEAYFRLAKRFHPDAHHDPALADLREKLEAVFIRLGEAYEVLRSPRSRASYESDLVARMPRGPMVVASAADEPAVDPAHEIKMAELSVRQAEKRFAEEKYWDAIQLLEPAIGKLEARPRARAQVLLAKAYAKNPKWAKRAEEALQQAIQDDPKFAESYYQLALIYKTGGIRSRALTMLRKAVELKPEHEQAAAELAALTPEEPEPAPEGGGLFKKLLRRN